MKIILSRALEILSAEARNLAAKPALDRRERALLIRYLKAALAAASIPQQEASARQRQNQGEF